MISRPYDSPIGQLQLTAKSGRLLRIGFEQDQVASDHAEHARYATDSAEPAAPDVMVLDTACQQLDEYFDGLRRRFDVPTALMGSPFQLKVWSVLLRVPFGRTLSYRDLARLIGQPGASRAVGAANAANPLPIIVPCHRVIASDGSLGGFSGGLEAKVALLDLERAGAPLFADTCG